MKLIHSVLAAPAWVLLAALPVAQEQPNPSSRTAQTPAATKGLDAESDGILATWLLIENNNEIALSELAVQRAQDPEVKSFAQKMIDQHREMAKKLQPFATAAGFTPSKGTFTTPGSTDRDDDDKNRILGPGQGTGAGAQTSSRGLDHIALLQDLGNQCLSTAKKELEQKQGSDFDRCFTGMALGAHMKMNDQMTVFQRYASSDLKETLRSGQQTVAMHLQQAKDLVKKVENRMQ